MSLQKTKNDLTQGLGMGDVDEPLFFGQTKKDSQQARMEALQTIFSEESQDNEQEDDVFESVDNFDDDEEDEFFSE